MVAPDKANDARVGIPSGKAFSLIELLVVVCIIGILSSFVLPAVARIRQSAKAVACQSQLHQLGVLLAAYAAASDGNPYPIGFGTNVPRTERWPSYIYPSHVWNPQSLLCPADIAVVESARLDGKVGEAHSYVLNGHLSRRGIRFGTTVRGLSSSAIILAGEKASIASDYYLDALPGENGVVSEYGRVVERYRHGLIRRSNCLYFDYHVEPESETSVSDAVDRWDVYPLTDADMPTTQP